MKQRFSDSPVRLRSYLAFGYALLIAYVSLTPFTGWQEQGLSFREVLVAPLMQTYTWSDALLNLLAYLPFGLLLGLYLREHTNWLASVVGATVLGGLLSGLMEFAQMYLPSRTSSNLDLLTNLLGTLGGALLAVSIAPRAWYALHLTDLRRKLFVDTRGAEFGLSLVALWMFAHINPSMPLLGSEFIAQSLPAPFVPQTESPFDPAQGAAVMLNLLMLGGLLLTLLRERRHALLMLVLILVVVMLAKFVAAALLLKSWALLLWLKSEAVLGMLVGALLLSVLASAPRGWLLALMAFSVFAYLGLTNLLLDSGNPAATLRLYQWRYAHLLNYNGLTQSAGMAFPLLLLAYLWRIRR